MTATATASPPTVGGEQLQFDLSAEEEAQLTRCEAVIARHREAVFEVGEALRTIRDQRLYRATHRTFEAYVDEHLGKSRIYAHRMIEAVKTQEDLLPIGNILLENENQARQVGKLTPEQQQEAYALLKQENPQEETPVTGKDLLAAAQRLSPPPVKPEPQAEPLPPPSAALQTFLDDAGDVRLPLSQEGSRNFSVGNTEQFRAAFQGDPDPIELPDSLETLGLGELAALQNTLTERQPVLLRKIQEPGENPFALQRYKNQLFTLNAALDRIADEWKRRTKSPVTPEQDETRGEAAKYVAAWNTPETRPEEASAEPEAETDPGFEQMMDALPEAIASIAGGDEEEEEEPELPAKTEAAQEIVSTLQTAATAPASTPPVAAAVSTSATSPSVTVTDKRENRTAASEGTGEKERTQQEKPSTATATASTTTAATSSAAANAWVSCMIPRGEKDYLDEEGLTAGTAIALLRDLRSQPAPVSQGIPLAPGYHPPFGAYVLSRDAQQALTLITERANKSGEYRAQYAQLEAILIQRAKLIDDTEFDAAGGK